MDTPRRSQIYKLEEYDIEIVPITDRRLSISISDSLRKAEYFEKDLVLENIVVNTLGKALERSIKDIRIHFQPKNTEEISLIEVRVTVESTFLKGVEEIFYLKKVRDIS